MVAFEVFDEDDEAEDVEDTNHMRRVRKHLRDMSDPFSMPDTEFISNFRLPKDFVHDVVIERMRRHLEPSGTNPSAVPLHLLVRILQEYYVKYI